MFPLRDTSPRERAPRPRAASALAVALVALLATGCGKDARTWRRQLVHEDEFERFLAALALCEAHPRRSAPAIRSVFWGLESGVPLYEAGARRALAQLEKNKLEHLIEFVVAAGFDRPRVRAEILPMLDRAGPASGLLLLEALTEVEWEAHPAVVAKLEELARSDPELRRALDRTGAGP